MREEAKGLDKDGIDWMDRLKISDRAQIIPRSLRKFERILESLREKDETGEKIGTTMKGIGIA